MSTNNKLKEYVKEEMGHLPEELREAINSFEWEKIAEEIGENNKLSGKEVLVLKVETALILVGLVNPKLYKQNIENNVGTSEKEAEKIAEETNQKIFTPIYNTLIENIKKSAKNKNHWQQNLDFVLSGGNYSSFMAPTPKEVGVPTSDALGRDIGEEKTNIPMKPKKITDIKSKLVI